MTNGRGFLVERPSRMSLWIHFFFLCRRLARTSVPSPLGAGRTGWLCGSGIAFRRGRLASMAYEVGIRADLPCLPGNRYTRPLSVLGRGGASMRSARVLLVPLIAAAVPGVPVTYASYRQVTCRHFHVVADGRLYRSGQLSSGTLERVVHEYRIRTIVSLR